MSLAQAIAVKVPPDFWALSALPEGYIERWLAGEGSQVEAGATIAMIRVEGLLHKLVAPATGKLLIEAAVNSVVDPGMCIARITPRLDA